MKAERSAAHQEGPLGAHADRRSARYRRLSRAVLSIAVACLLPGIALAQVPPGAPAGAPPAPAMSAAELETLVAPVALYPDDLLGILLPAATTPLDIVKAQRFLEQRKSNPNLQPDAKLPDPVRSLLNYPEIVKTMSDNLDWTVKLGEAVVAQQGDVMAAVQTFRRKVQSAGNLKSDDKQIVIQEKEVIKIVPADPQVIYVPQYQPTTVVIHQTAPPVAYYPTPYPVYYYPYPPGAAFATGLFVGATTAYAIGWANHSIYHQRWDDHYHEIEHYQQNRMDYANQSREDWQSHSAQQQTQRQQETQQRQTQRQEQVGQSQTQRQQAGAEAQTQRGEMQAQRQQAGAQAQTQRGETQAQRQQAATQAQAQGGQTQVQRPPSAGQTPAQRPQSATQAQAQGGQAQAQRQQAATQAQTQRGGGQASGQAWKPQQGTGPSGGAQAQPANMQSRPGNAQGSAAGGGAFGGVGSGSNASFDSQRGAASRSSSAATSSRGGARSGGGGRRR